MLQYSKNKWEFYLHPDGGWVWKKTTPKGAITYSAFRFISKDFCIKNAKMNGYNNAAEDLQRFKPGEVDFGQ